MNEYLNKLNCVILPSISINESSTSINGAYVVKDEKTYTLTEETIFVSQLFHNDIKEGLFKAESYMYIKNCKSKVSIKNKVVNLFCDIEGLSYETDGRDLSSVFQQNEYIQEIKELLKYKIHKVFTEYKKIKLDIFGINKYIYKYHPILYKKVHTEYLDYFSELDLNIEIKIKLLSSGLTEDTLE